MATIVWLPVPTAMVGQMSTDPMQEVVYIGTLVLTQVTTLAGRIYLLRHPELTTASVSRIRFGAAADVAAIILFCAALAIAVAIGPPGCFALLLLSFTGLLARLLNRIGVGRGRAQAAPGSPE